ncbi:uncharacterized protein TNCV_1030951 [Trichonephila clavipes]|nr:uncharacterized protein TNCV_1030951 [Trichonephila clavipes]
MAGYYDLSEFERGVIVCVREMGHSISKIAMKFGFSSTTISRAYREYREFGKTSNLRHHAAGKRSCKNGTNNDLRESLSLTDVQPFRKLLQIIMLGHQQLLSGEPFNETLSTWAFGVECHLVYPC